jgi:hypothetical protein
MTFAETFQLVLSDPTIRACLILLAAAPGLHAISRIWHDRKEFKLRMREVEAREAQAAGITRIAKVLEVENGG